MVFAITSDAMRRAVETTWGEWNDADQRRRFERGYDPRTHRLVIVDDDVVAGVVAVEDRSEHVFLSKLYLRDGHRRRGVGTEVLSLLSREADALGKPLRLRVLEANVDAQRFYRREGFAETGAEPPYRWFERATGVSR